MCGSATNVQQPENFTRLMTMAGSYYEVDFAGSHPREKFRKVMAISAQQSDNFVRVERVLDQCQRTLSTDANPWSAVDVGAGLGVFLAKLLHVEHRAAPSFHHTRMIP